MWWYEMRWDEMRWDEKKKKKEDKKIEEKRREERRRGEEKRYVKNAIASGTPLRAFRGTVADNVLLMDSIYMYI